ncbi:Di-copper centre-containing protein [Agrocybe pediades]|nr:Di-copper centre-containing protein [Agrocybe pediades]
MLPLTCRSWASLLIPLHICALALAHIVQHELDSDLDLELSEIPLERCSHTLIRQEWRTLSDAHKQQYIDAVKCTQSLPQITTFEGVQSRFDDFQAVHIHTADSIHYVGHFLPWHRRFVKIYETTLRNDCGYRGAIPYWDWTLDVHNGSSILNSPVFDPTTGFGGDGVPGTFNISSLLSEAIIESSQIYLPSFVGCVQDGPFANFTVHLGPGKAIQEHCLMRGVDDEFTESLSREAVEKALAQPTFEKFRVELEGGEDRPSEHGSGHLVIGGDLGNLYSSPADPLFFLHHANLDRLWWKWQTMDLRRRLTDISGKTLPFATPKHKTNVALDFMLKYDRLAASIPIKEIMDVREFPLCYVYE